MKYKIQVLLALISALITSQASAISKLPDSIIPESEQEVMQTHNAIRSVSLRMSLDDNMHGFVESKTCSFCKTIRITITPKTRAFENNINVPLKKAKNRIGRHATIIYDLKTKQISAIRW